MIQVVLPHLKFNLIVQSFVQIVSHVAIDFNNNDLSIIVDIKYLLM